MIALLLQELCAEIAARPASRVKRIVQAGINKQTANLFISFVDPFLFMFVDEFLGSERNLHYRSGAGHIGIGVDPMF